MARRAMVRVEGRVIIGPPESAATVGELLSLGA